MRSEVTNYGEEMPVEDHPIHEHGVREEGHRYGCYNRPDKFQPLEITSVEVVGSKPVVVTRSYPHRMTHGCMYDRSETDKACNGCKHVGNGAKMLGKSYGQRS